MFRENSNALTLSRAIIIWILTLINFLKFLGFSLSFNGVVRYFAFRVLPFGLSSACYTFTKMSVARWRSLLLLCILMMEFLLAEPCKMLSPLPHWSGLIDPAF